MSRVWRQRKEVVLVAHGQHEGSRRAKHDRRSDRLIVGFWEATEPESREQEIRGNFLGPFRLGICFLCRVPMVSPESTPPARHAFPRLGRVLGLLAPHPGRWATSHDRRFPAAQVWENIPGNSINDLTSDPRFPEPPVILRERSPAFETPTDFAEQYGQRVHGYIVPRSPAITFWIASDDNGALYLSTDNTPAKRQLICSVPDWTASRQWDKFPDQQSAPIRLVAGQTYIRALQGRGTAGDNLAVRWLRPDGLDKPRSPPPTCFPYGTSFTHPSSRSGRRISP